MRKIQAIGNVTRDAEVHTRSQDNIAINFSLAVTDKWTNREGQKVEKTTFIKCVLWCKKPTIAQYIKKGIKVYVEGIPEAEAYIGKEQNVVANLKIVVRNIELLSSLNKPVGSPIPTTTAQETSVPEDEMPTPDQDLPF